MPNDKSVDDDAMWTPPKKRTLGKPWSVTKVQLEAIRKMSRADLESAYVGQLEIVQRFMRVVKMVKQTLKQADLMGL